MPHPVIPQVLALAEPVAKALELEIVDAVYHTHHQPPTLRVDVRSHKEGTGLEDCERMSRSLETALDDANVMPEAYVLEVSSPGVSEFLTQDRDFAAFRGFPVTVQTTEPVEIKTGSTSIKKDAQFPFPAQSFHRCSFKTHLKIWSAL
jgi:ribosome maturation factor RimP